MKVIVKSVAILLVTLSFSSCKKESKIISANNETSETVQEELKNRIPSAEMISFHNSCEEVSMKALDDLIKLFENSASPKASAVWGVGFDDKVWKWNGSTSSWGMPNAAARLRTVSLSAYGGGVWGVGNDNKVWKWDPSTSSWGMPNAAARLYTVAAYSGTHALGIGYNGSLYVTYDGGASWGFFTGMQWFYDISVGNTVANPLWAVRTPNNVPSLWQYESTGIWNYKPTPVYPRLVSAEFGCCGGWFLEDAAGSRRIFRTNGSTTWEPSPTARLKYSISARDTEVWGTGDQGRVFYSNNSGTSYSEPNPAARLRTVNYGFE